MEVAKRFLIDFKRVEIGDILFDVTEGPVKVEKIRDHRFTDYVISVKTMNGSSKELTYTSDGKSLIENKNPSLFKSCPFITEEIDQRLSQLITRFIVGSDKKEEGVEKNEDFLEKVDSNKEPYQRSSIGFHRD